MVFFIIGAEKLSLTLAPLHEYDSVDRSPKFTITSALVQAFSETFFTNKILENVLTWTNTALTTVTSRFPNITLKHCLLRIYELPHSMESGSTNTPIREKRRTSTKSELVKLLAVEHRKTQTPMDTLVKL